MSGLRKLLGSEVLVTSAGGYRLDVAPEALDCTRFERLVEEGRAALAEGRPGDAEERLREALELWRGPALANVVFEGGDRTEVARLDELRLGALEDRFEALVALGRHGELVGELEVLAGRHPLRERIASLLMLALYRSGRQGDALAAYGRLRRALVDKLAIEPTPAVQRLEHAILRQDPALELVAVTPIAVPAPARKPVTVVAAELEYEAVDPEAEQAVVGRIVRELAGVASALGAAVEIDDRSLTAIFGVPAVREDDAVRALRCAAALQELAASRSLALRIGVASGEAVVDAEGATGPPLREAARLQHAAEAGTVLVSDGVHALVGVGAALAPAGGDRWRLVSVTGDAQPMPRRLDAPLVGRDAEIERLESIVALAEGSGRCQLVTVTGAAGIGKSRLTRELAKRLVGRAEVATGRCRAPGEAHAFAPLGEIVREAVGEEAAAVDHVLKHTRDGKLIGERLAAALEGRGVPEQALWATRKLLERLAQQRPLVVVFDDAHWADEMLRDLVDYLVDWSRDAPLVLVCLARPELLDERRRWGEQGERVHPLPLEPLSAEESSALIAGLASLDDAICVRIAAAAEGNPLFIEQMVAMLRESASADEVRVPPTIHALLAARLDLLPSAERELLERAAVLGREFRPDSLVGLDASRTEAAPALLDAIVRKQLLGREGDRYRFAHQLIRDAAYEAIPKLVRAELHELVADRFDDDDAVAGHHLERAYRCLVDVDPEGSYRELAQRAAARLFAAGRTAYSRGDVPIAIAFFERGASLPSDDPAARAELLIAVAGALRETTDFDRAAVALEEASALAEGAGRRDLVGEARVLGLRLGISIDSDLAADELRANAEEAIREFEELGDERGLGEAWLVVAWSSWLRCRAGETERALRRGIEHARRAEDERSLVFSRNLLLGAGLFGPMPVAQAEQRCLDMLEEDTLPVRLEAAANRALGALAAMRGDFAASQACFERDRELIQEAGLRLAAMAAAEVWAQSELLAGNVDAAERRLRDALTQLPPREKSAFSTLAAVLAEVLCRASRYEEALELSIRSEEASTPDDFASEVQWRAARAKAAAALGDSETAKRLAAEAVSLAATTDFPNLHGNALVASAEVTGSAGDLERAAGLFERKGNVVAAARARELLSVRA